MAWLDDPPDQRGIRFAAGEEWEWWPWTRLAELVRRAAAGLLENGLRAGERVAIVESGSPQFVGALFGAMAAGGVPSPMPPPLPLQDTGQYSAQLAHPLGAGAPAYIAVRAGLRAVVQPAAARAGVRLLDLDELLACDPLARPQLPQGDDIALLQFTSGTSGRARPVLISAAALEANTEAIQRWLEMTASDATAAWLPVHHDMGLIGCLLTPAARGSDLWLMRPEDFIRSPVRYLRCFGELGARLTAMPSFGLEHIVRRVTPADLEGMDFSQWRAIIVGAERIPADLLERCAELLGHAGLKPEALLPAYGLAEATLAVTGLPLADRWSAAVIDGASIAPGARVREAQGDDGEPVVGCGGPLTAAQVRIEDDCGRRLADGTVGEIAVGGASIMSGYGADGPGNTSLADGWVRTGDAGFVSDGQLYVLGRLGDALKVRGRSVFAEDVEAALHARGIPSARAAALLGHRAGTPTAVVLLEEPRHGWHDRAAAVLRVRAAGAAPAVLDVPRGTIARTTSGKPRRRRLWAALMDGRLADGVLALDHIQTSEQEEGIRV